MKELTPEEQAQLDSMSDAEERPSIYQWGEDFQRRIIAMLLRDINFLIEAQGLVQAQYFENEVHKLLCRILFKYFEKYESVPHRVILEQELSDAIKEKDAKVRLYFQGEFSTVYDYYVPGLEERDYLRDRIVDFAKEQAVKVAFFKSLEILKNRDAEEKWTKVYGMLEDAMRVDRKFDIGHDYFHDYENRYRDTEKQMAEQDLFTSGFASIDNNLSDGGICRGEIASWMGLSGSGKSLALVRASLANLERDHKVLYITLEINETKTAQRFDAQLADPTRKWGIGINNLIENKDKVFESLANYVADKEDEKILLIKQFPGGEMDVPRLRAYLNQVKLEGFKADLVIVDYIGEMKDYPGMATWESRQRIVRDLRGIAVTENIGMFVAMQPDRRAKEVVRQGDLIDDDNLADSYGQVRPLDCLWSLNQMADEQVGNIARVKIIKHRSGEKGKIFFVKMDPETLQISEISREVYTEIKRQAVHNRDVDGEDVAAEKMAEQKYYKQQNGKKGKKAGEEPPRDAFNDEDVEIKMPGENSWVGTPPEQKTDNEEKEKQCQTK